jgi:hypothetical protein
VEIVSTALIVLFLGAAIARPLSWRAGKALLLAGFFLLQGWSRVHGLPAASPTFGAFELVVGGMSLASGIHLTQQNFRVARVRGPVLQEA